MCWEEPKRKKLDIVLDKLNERDDELKRAEAGIKHSVDRINEAMARLPKIEFMLGKILDKLEGRPAVSLTKLMQNVSIDEVAGRKPKPFKRAKLERG